MRPTPSELEVKIDFLSDAVNRTQPSQGMREAIANVVVGDEQNGEDPATNELLEMVKELLGKEEAVLLPSGTMCNEMSLAVHCRPGDEIILAATGHPIHFEGGAPAAMAGAMVRPLEGQYGKFTAAQVDDAVRSPSRLTPRSRVVAVEQTTNVGGGVCWSVDELRPIVAVAKEHGLRTHLDGARLMNAVVATGTPAAEFCAGFDSAWIDLCKGLGAPLGAVLAGSAEFIDEVWRLKQRWGGGMRQTGFIAAAGIYALRNNVERLADDHRTARLFAERIAQNEHVGIDLNAVQTNLVFFDLVDTPWTSDEFAALVLRHGGVRLLAVAPGRMRVATHPGISADDARVAADIVCDVLDTAT